MMAVSVGGVSGLPRGRGWHFVAVMFSYLSVFLGEKRCFDGVGWADASLGVALVGRASRRVAGNCRTCGFSFGENQYLECGRVGRKSYLWVFPRREYSFRLRGGGSKVVLVSS